MIAEYVQNPAREVSSFGVTIKYFGRKTCYCAYKVPYTASPSPHWIAVACKHEPFSLADGYIKILDPVTDVRGEPGQKLEWQ